MQMLCLKLPRQGVSVWWRGRRMRETRGIQRLPNATVVLKMCETPARRPHKSAEEKVVFDNATLPSSLVAGQENVLVLIQWTCDYSRFWFWCHGRFITCIFNVLVLISCQAKGLRSKIKKCGLDSILDWLHSFQCSQPQIQEKETCEKR
jgi:hypothetical protein